MTRRNFILGSIFYFSMPLVKGVLGSENDSVALINKYRRDYPGLSKFEIIRPGRYHIEKNEIERKMYWGKGGYGKSPTGGAVLNIMCGSVDLDLRGFTLGAESNTGGISLFPAVNIELADRFPDETDAMARDNRFVKVHNGKIDVAHGEKGGIGIDFTDVWHAHNQRPRGRPEVRESDAINYIRNEYSFERLKISSQQTALAVEGTHTRIRDCRIESAGMAAIFSAGGNLLIENCDIYLRKPKWNRWRTSAAILLRDGSHAVIRNNRIFFEDGDVDGWEVHCILIRDGARNVVIENNIFINFKRDPVTLAEGATAIIRENKSEKHKDESSNSS